MASAAASFAVFGHGGGCSASFFGCVVAGSTLVTLDACPRSTSDVAFVSGLASGLVLGLVADFRRLFLVEASPGFACGLVSGLASGFLASVLGPAFVSGLVSGLASSLVPSVAPFLGPDHVLLTESLF